MRLPGKIVVDEFYVHLSAVSEVQNQHVIAALERVAASLPQQEGLSPNVAKVNLRSGRVSLLAYPFFEDEPFPVLAAAWVFQPNQLEPSFRSYSDSLNPPVLHRKERLVSWTHPQRAHWEAITSSAEALGLFDDTSTIGFKLNWERLIASKGYQLAADSFLPLANVTTIPNGEEPDGEVDRQVQRHLTALSRASLSAPVQLLMRHGLLVPGRSFFDYGCGRGTDVATLSAQGYEARGWDPHYAAAEPRVPADIVNLGFVVNVIEDAGERIEALTQAFALTRSVMAVGVMLAGGEVPGKPFRDGYLSSRNTFQKYFSQAELKDWLEHCLHRQVFVVGPGIAFVFADHNAEQTFAVGRYQTGSLAVRLISTRRRTSQIDGRPSCEKRVSASRKTGSPVAPRQSAAERRQAEARPVLERLWRMSLDLGRFPERDEVPDLAKLKQTIGPFSKALRLLVENFDQGLLSRAETTRRDDLRVFLATQHFAKRSAYRELAPRLQRDIKCFFGDYRTAQDEGLRLLVQAAESAEIRRACKQAAAEGLGCLEAEHSLQFHVSLIERLPAVLRAFVACGLQLWESLSGVDLVKIHIESGKLTLMEFDGFDKSPLPLLRRRIKVHVRRLTYDLFEYGTPEFPQPPLYFKSRFLSEEHPGYAEQLAFDEQIKHLNVIDTETFGPKLTVLAATLAAKRLAIDGMRLVPSQTIPDLDDPCGVNFTYRDFIKCGETQRRLNLENLPRLPDSYNALYALATALLDPIIEYFGAIRLTYGFASPELIKNVRQGIAPKLDQHCCYEVTSRGTPICPRLGAACDFFIEDENMHEVADWIRANLPFDRLYFYGADRPIHLSYAPEPAGEAFAMVRAASGRLVPRPYRPSGALRSDT